MIGKLFEVQGDNIIPKEDCYLIKPLKQLFDTFPDKFPAIVAYLHYMVSLNPMDNPFADLPEHSKSETIQRHLNIDIDPEDMYILYALNCVKELYQTSIYRSYLSLKALLDNINSGLESIQIDYSRDGNSSGIVQVVKTLSTIKKELVLAQKDYKEEMGGFRARADADISYDEFDKEKDLYDQDNENGDFDYDFDDDEE